MWHSVLTSMALVVAAQGRPVRASEAVGPLAPSMVRLDFRDQTLDEIVQAVDAQGPTRMAVHRWGGRFRGEPVPPTRRYTIREPAPVTLWEAADRIGRETETWPTTGAAGRHVGVLLEPASADRGFARNDGAFRIVLTGTYFVSRFQFAPYFYKQSGFDQPRPDGSSRRPRLSASLLLMAEPRLKIVRPVELVVREAVDDRGRVRIPAVPWRQPLTKPPGRSYPSQDYVAIPLRPTDDPGGRLRRLAGSVVLEAAEDRPDAAGALIEVRFDFADVLLP